MTAREVAGNRTALLLPALVFLLAGVWLVVGHRAVRPGAGTALPLPGWWPLPRAEFGAAGAHAWWAHAVMGALGLVLVLLLAGLLRSAVRSTRRRTRLALARPRLSLSPDALARAMTTQVSDLAGVSGARVGPVRGGRTLYVRITVFLERRSDPEAVLRCLEEGPLNDARAALAPAPVRADVRFRVRRRGLGRSGGRLPRASRVR